MSTPAYSLPPSSYVSPYSYSMTSANGPYGKFDNSASPEDMNRRNAVEAYKQQQTVNTGLTGDRNEFTNNSQRYGGALENIYMDQVNGGWGLTPEQQANILDQPGLSTFNPQQQMADWRGDTGNLMYGLEAGAGDTRAASQELISSLYDAVDPIAGYDDKIQGWTDNLWDTGWETLDTNDAAVNEWLTSMKQGASAGGPWTSGGGMSLYGGGGGSGWSGGSASVGNVDLSGLDLDQAFLDGYKLTPEMKQAWQNLATQGAGARYRSGLDTAQRNMAAAGIANPYADSAMRERYEMREGQALDDARLQAIVGAEGEEDRRLLDVENLRSGNERTRAGINANIATTNAQLQDSALGRSFSASENAASRSLQSQLAAAAEAANMERFYKDLGFKANQTGVQTTAGMGDRRLGFLGDATDFESSQWNQREQDLADRLGTVGTVGYGANLSNEQNIFNSRNAALGNIATGTQDVYKNTNSTGLDYSNAASNRWGSIYDYDNAQKQGGVAGMQGLYDTNTDARQNTWNQQISNNANQGQLQNDSIGQLGGYKNGKPLGFVDSLKQKAGEGIGKGIAGAVTGRIPG